MLDNRKPAILPEDVLELLKKADAAIEARTFVALSPYELRELVTVWLRVAALFELVEATPTDFDPEMRCAVEALMLGQCEHLVQHDTEHDTEPHHDKPEPLSTQRCRCGAEWPARLPDFPNLECPACGELVQ